MLTAPHEHGEPLSGLRYGQHTRQGHEAADPSGEIRTEVCIHNARTTSSYCAI